MEIIGLTAVGLAFAVFVFVGFIALAVFVWRTFRRPPSPPAVATVAAPLAPMQVYHPPDPLTSFDNAAAPYLREEIFRGVARHQADKWWEDMAAAASKLGPKPPAAPLPPPVAPPNG